MGIPAGGAHGQGSFQSSNERHDVSEPVDGRDTAAPGDLAGRERSHAWPFPVTIKPSL